MPWSLIWLEGGGLILLARGVKQDSALFRVPEKRGNSTGHAVDDHEIIMTRRGNLQDWPQRYGDFTEDPADTESSSSGNEDPTFQEILVQLLHLGRATGSSILDHDFGHFCRGKRIHISAPSHVASREKEQVNKIVVSDPRASRTKVPVTIMDHCNPSVQQITNCLRSESYQLDSNKIPKG